MSRFTIKRKPQRISISFTISANVRENEEGDLGQIVMREFHTMLEIHRADVKARGLLDETLSGRLKLTL